MRQKRRPPFNSTRYYIEEVVRYRSGYEAGERSVNSYLPLMSEMQLAILISVRMIRFALFLLRFVAAVRTQSALWRLCRVKKERKWIQ